MILNFLNKFKDKKRTFFLEKILARKSVLYSFLDKYMIQDIEGIESLLAKHNYSIDWNEIIKESKKHTIRADKSKRWKAGNKIHFTINSRTKNQFQFAEGKCISVQDIEILHNISLPFGIELPQGIYVDNGLLDTEHAKKLAINDGFQSLEAFYDFFDKDFVGKIIHWTKLKY